MVQARCQLLIEPKATIQEHNLFPLQSLSSITANPNCKLSFHPKEKLMPDPSKVKIAIIGSVLVIGASIGIGIGVSQKNRAADGAIVENQSAVVPKNNENVAYKDPSPTNAKDILDDLESSARYGAYTGNYIDYGSNPLEEVERSNNDDGGEVPDWDDDGDWTDDGWDDDGWNDVSDFVYDREMIFL
jgi:hypothetical protein